MPRSSRLLLVIGLLVTSVATACGADATTDTDATGAAGDMSWPHDFTATLVGGGTIDAGDYAGQDLVLWFWAPW